MTATPAEQLRAALRDEYGINPVDCDPESALEIAVDLGLLSIDEAASDLGHKTVTDWLKS